MKNILLIPIVFFFTHSIFSQVVPPINCTSAIVICDSIIVQDTLKVAIDSTADEISSNSCLTYGEVRGTWYQFGVNSIGNLRFNIIPFDTLTDFDWALFRVDWADCTNIFGIPSYEVSCNVSGIGGGNYTTGADGAILQGHNPAVNITAPSVFFLYITTSLQDTGALLGYTIDFSASDFDLVNCNEIGIQDENQIKVNMYPNPFDEYLAVELPNKESVEIYLYDIAGRSVGLQAPYHAVDKYYLSTDHLSSGMYNLVVISEQGISVKKVIKN